MNTQEEGNAESTQASQTEGSEASAWHFECEWTLEADAENGFHHNQKYCKKNPGHKNFIPVGQFSIEHLPPDWRDGDIVELTEILADLTAKVCVRYTSVDRPETFPDTEDGQRLHDYKDVVGQPYPFSEDRGSSSITRAGTACVYEVSRFKGECKCEVNCPHKNGGEMQLKTARHVVYDDSEAEKTELLFHYDSTGDQKKGRKERARKVGHCSTEKDVCDLSFYSHDAEFLDWLEEKLKRRDALWEKLCKAYKKPVTTGTFSSQAESILKFPMIIVSHPHGGPKMVTVGECTQVQQGKGKDSAVYFYNTATCPGSSGAMVFCVSRRFSVGMFTCAPHSASMKGGLNSSAAGWWLN